MTFDRKKFDFQGTCVYQLAALCSTNTELEQFEVRVQNEHRRSRTVSFTKLVEVKVYSLSIIITTSYKGKILVRTQSTEYYLNFSSYFDNKRDFISR